MLAGLAVLVGIAVAAAVVFFVGRRSVPGDPSSHHLGALGWWALGLGTTGLVAVVVPLVLSRIGPEWPNLALNPALLSIAEGVSGVIVGGYALARGGSRRLLWLVLIPGAVTVVIWLAFLVGEFVSPH